MPFTKGCKPGPGRPKGMAVHPSARELCQRIVEDPAYLQALHKAAISRELDPKIEQMLWCYAKGPVPAKARIEHTGLNEGPLQVSVVPTSQLTDAQLDVLEQVLLKTSGGLVARGGDSDTIN